MTTAAMKPTVAFFGATGGCALAALSFSLEAGYTCSALVRSKEKLTNLLKERNLSDSALKNLILHEGDAKDVEAVKAALQKSTGGVHDIIISGIGGRPKKSANPLKIVMDDPAICENAAKILVSALESLRGSSPSYNPPLVCVISSTGLDQRRDIPIAMVPLYHWLLAVPHVDKKKLEEVILSAPEGLFNGSIVIRPSLLVGKIRHGSNKVKAGYEGRTKNGGRWGDVEGVSIGYAISREDVGGFIFEEIVELGGGEWVGKKISLTE